LQAPVVSGSHICSVWSQWPDEQSLSQMHCGMVLVKTAGLQ
jgi:hypothetical protein